jgi:hypothetical protein
MSILNQASLSFCQTSLTSPSDARLLAKAVCRLPLTADYRHLFAKPPLPSVSDTNELFGRPPVPTLIRPLRRKGGFDQAQLNRLFDKVIGQARWL